MKDMTESKYPSQGKVRSQEKEAKEGVALGLEISPYHIQGNGVTIYPALEETHLGICSIYKPKKVVCRKNSDKGRN